MRWPKKGCPYLKLRLKDEFNRENLRKGEENRVFSRMFDITLSESSIKSGGENGKTG